MTTIFLKDGITWKSGTLREMVLYDMGKKSYIYTEGKYQAQIAALKKIIDDLWVCSLIFALKKSD